MGKIIGERDGTRKHKEGLERNGTFWIRRYSFDRIYIIIADDVNETADDILLVDGVPELGAKVGACYVMSREPDEQTTLVYNGVLTMLWHVTVRFDSRADTTGTGLGGGSGGSPDSPEDWIPRESWDYIIENEHQSRDAEGELVVNSVGERLFTEFPTALFVLHHKRYRPAPYDPNIGFQYGNKSNLNVFRGAPAGCAWLLPPKISEPELINESYYHLEEWEVRFKLRLEAGGVDPVEDALDIELLNEGTKYYENAADPAANIPPVPALIDGQPTTVNLNLDGTRRSLADEPIYLPFKRLTKVDVDPLQIESGL